MSTAGRRLLCAYSENGETFVGPLVEQESPYYSCPSLQDYSAGHAAGEPFSVSVVASSATGGIVLNLTAAPCSPALDPFPSAPTHLAWLQPPGAPCGEASHHLLRVRGELPLADELKLAYSGILSEPKQVEGEGAERLSTYEVTL